MQGCDEAVSPDLTQGSSVACTMATLSVRPRIFQGVEGAGDEHGEPQRQRHSAFPVPPGSDPTFDGSRSMPSGICWWCREQPATTREHKYKLTDLRRMALADGVVDPSNLFRGGESYEGGLRSIKKGSAVQWSKNMCKACNGGRDRDFDAAYELFSEYVWDHQEHLLRAQILRWPDIYPEDWRREARNLARYLGKQLGCMLATQCLPVPQSLIRFLDGRASCPDVSFRIYRDMTKVSLHQFGREQGEDMRGYWMPSTPAFRDAETGAFSGCDFGYVIGHIGFAASWRHGHRTSNSFFRHRWTRIVNTGEYVDLNQFSADDASPSSSM